MLIPKTRYEEYLAIVAEVEQQFDIVFEHENYKAIYYLSVNDYIAITYNGVKQKGSFVTNPDLGDSTDFLIIPKALKAYFVEGINPKEFIKNHINSHSKAIYDYCMSPKVDKSYVVEWCGEKQQRLNIFYPTNDNTKGYIYKTRDGSKHHLLKDSPVQLFNNYHSGPYNINFNYFNFKINEIIDKLEPKQLTLF